MNVSFFLSVNSCIKKITQSATKYLPSVCDRWFVVPKFTFVILKCVIICCCTLNSIKLLKVKQILIIFDFGFFTWLIKKK